MQFSIGILFFFLAILADNYFLIVVVGLPVSRLNRIISHFMPTQKYDSKNMQTNLTGASYISQ